MPICFVHFPLIIIEIAGTLFESEIVPNWFEVIAETERENQMEFQQGNESITNVSEIGNSNKPSDDFLALPPPPSAWDPLVSLSQPQTFGRSSMVTATTHNDFCNASNYHPLVLEAHQGMVHYMSDSNLEGMVPKIPSYGSGSFSDMLVRPGGSGDIGNMVGYRPSYYGNHGKDAAGTMNEQSQVEGSITEEEGVLGSEPSGNHRRKRVLDRDSSFIPNKNAADDEMKDSPGKSSDGSKEHEKKAKVEQNTSADLRGKQSAKQAKDGSQSGEAPKENFIHVRARRGQATNSHSLAERVRREKISERMKLLQELVPGCNKITGKAVMLDEIINYVQSLQQQVEFLSMKLATVNPDMNFDVERILSRDILQSPLGHGIGGYGPGISSSHPFPNGSFPGTMVGMPSTSTQFPPLPRAVLDHEFQSLYAIGYDSSTALDNLGPNGRLKPEL